MNWKKGTRLAKDYFMAILQGKFLLKIHFDRYFPQILYTCFLFWLSIWFGMQVEKTMVKVEKTKVVLNDLKIYHAQQTVTLAGFNRISTLETMLKERGSDVAFPEKPATKLEK